MTNEQIEALKRDGFVFVRDVLEPERLTALRVACDRVATQVAPDALRHRVVGSTGRYADDRIDPVTDLSTWLAGVAQDERILGLVRDALGEDGLLLNDRLITKPPGALGYGLHQDHPYYTHVGIPSDAILVVAVAIDAADAESGAIELFRGYHGGALPAPADEPLDVTTSAVDPDRAVLAVMEAGDVLLMHGYTPHRSAPNRSSVSRRSLQLVYNRAAFGDRYAQFQAERTYG